MTLFNVTFTDVDVERTITVEADSEELANYIAKTAYGREPTYVWDGTVGPAPEPPPVVLDVDNTEHPNYGQFATADAQPDDATDDV